MSRSEPLTVADRLAAIPQDAILSIREIAVRLGHRTEPWVRLEVDRRPMVALPRKLFIDLWHHGYHHVAEDDDGR